MSLLDQHRHKPEVVPPVVVDRAAQLGYEPFVEMLDAPEEFRVETLSSDGVHRVVLRGELDLVGAPTLWRRICEVCAQPTRGLRLDLRKLTFMDSSGLHVVLHARELCAHKGVHFAIVGGTPPIRRLFEVSGLGALLQRQRP